MLFFVTKIHKRLHIKYEKKFLKRFPLRKKNKIQTRTRKQEEEIKVGKVYAIDKVAKEIEKKYP